MRAAQAGRCGVDRARCVAQGQRRQRPRRRRGAEAAKQFEALFMQQLMKSMRAATMSSGMLDNEGSKLGTEMLDTQFATKMTGLPGGLADIIAKQLERQMARSRRSRAPPPHRPPPRARPAQGHEGGRVRAAAMDAAARAAEAETGIPAAFMIAQAAHETAGAGARSATPTARPRTTSSASRPGRPGRARWPR